ncbi:MAG TPA: ribokinase [Jatrophihabitantaceae bacterium]|jgi:ribokinase
MPIRITVLGSANMDLVVNADRAPRLGETVTGGRFRTVPGGKGANQALAAARAGGEVRFAGAVGDDVYGTQIRALLAAGGVDVSALDTAAAPTGTAHITVDAAGANSIVVVPGANGTVQALSEVHRAAIAGAEVLLLQLELPMAAVVEAARCAHSRGVAVVLTPAPAARLPAELLDAVDLLVPNEHEAAALNLSPAEHRDLLVTLGAAGARYERRGLASLTIPAFQVAAVDTTGAGDAFVGAFAVARGEHTDLDGALRWASAAAALSVQRFGASASLPDRAEIDAFLREHSAER